MDFLPSRASSFGDSEGSGEDKSSHTPATPSDKEKVGKEKNGAYHFHLVRFYCNKKKSSRGGGGGGRRERERGRATTLF